MCGYARNFIHSTVRDEKSAFCVSEMLHFGPLSFVGSPPSLPILFHVLFLSLPAHFFSFNLYRFSSKSPPLSLASALVVTTFTCNSARIWGKPYVWFEAAMQVLLIDFLFSLIFNWIFLSHISLLSGLSYQEHKHEAEATYAFLCCFLNAPLFLIFRLHVSNHWIQA